MVELELIILVIFRLVNFGVMIGIGYYLFKKHVKSQLIDQMNAEKKEVFLLEQFYKQLQIDQRTLEDTIKKEQQEQRQLREKVMQWHDALALKKERLAHEHAQRKHNLEMQYQQQINTIQKDHIAKEILPLVIDRARTTLVNQFASSHEQAAYFEHVAGVMKKMGSS